MRMLHARESRVQTRRPSLRPGGNSLCLCAPASAAARPFLSLERRCWTEGAQMTYAWAGRPEDLAPPLEWQNEPEMGALPAQGGSRQQAEKASSRHPQTGPLGDVDPLFPHG